MKLKSIKAKITFVAGAGLLTISAIIVLCSVIVIKGDAEYQYNEAAESSKNHTSALASRYAGNVREKLSLHFAIARTLAETLSGIKDEEIGVELGRDEVNGLLKTVLKRNPRIVGIYTCWELNAFDGMDKGFENVEGHDQTGRFIPYWSRGDGGKISQEPLQYYEDEGKGAFYLQARNEKKECVLNPFFRSVQGKNVLIISLVVPISIDDMFYGVVGIDISPAFFQEMANDVKDLQEGSSVDIISYDGTLVAVTDKPELTGKHMKEIHGDWQDDVKAIKEGRFDIHTYAGHLEVIVPANIGGTNTRWSVIISVPIEKITYKAKNRMLLSMQNIWKIAGVSIFFFLYCNRAFEGCN